MCETSKSGLGFAIGVDGGSVHRVHRRSPLYHASGHLHTDYIMGPRPPQGLLVLRGKGEAAFKEELSTVGDSWWYAGYASKKRNAAITKATTKANEAKRQRTMAIASARAHQWRPTGRP